MFVLEMNVVQVTCLVLFACVILIYVSTKLILVNRYYKLCHYRKIKNKQTEKLQKELEFVKKDNARLQSELDSIKNVKADGYKYNPLLDDILNPRSEKYQGAAAVKSLILNGKISMRDVDKDGETLLMSARREYDIIELCINLGADVNYKNEKGNTAMDRAKAGAWTHVEQLLLFHKLNANVSDKVENISFNINKQNGIISNIINELNTFSNQSEVEIFKKLLVSILCTIINNKLSFSDDLLNLAWAFECENEKNPFLSKLWNVILTASNDIIQNGNKKDWYWFKNFILSSNVCGLIANKIFCLDIVLNCVCLKNPNA